MPPSLDRDVVTTTILFLRAAFYWLTLDLHAQTPGYIFHFFLCSIMPFMSMWKSAFEKIQMHCFTFVASGPRLQTLSINCLEYCNIIGPPCKHRNTINIAFYSSSQIAVELLWASEHLARIILNFLFNQS